MRLKVYGGICYGPECPSKNYRKSLHLYLLSIEQIHFRLKSNMAQISNLTNLYSELNKYGQNQDFERALKIANKSMNISYDILSFDCEKYAESSE